MTRINIFSIWLLLVCFFFTTKSIAQNQDSTSYYSRKFRPAYSEMGLGVGQITIRDFATSPLFYKGMSSTILLGNLRRDERVESNFGIVANFGLPENVYNNTANYSAFMSADINYYRLYCVDRWSTGKWNTKMGANIISSTNLRINSAFMNNATGIENISNLMFSAKVTRDISITREKTINFYYFKKKIKPMKLHLSYFLNIGVLNMNYRPGYAYNYLPEMEGAEAKLLSDYRFSLNGFRIQSRIDLTRHIFNGNGKKISYVFDVYSAPGKYEPFQFASHSIQYSILFNYK